MIELPIIGQKNHVKLKMSTEKRPICPGKTRFAAFGYIWLIIDANPSQNTIRAKVIGELGKKVPSGTLDCIQQLRSRQNV